MYASMHVSLMNLQSFYGISSYQTYPKFGIGYCLNGFHTRDTKTAPQNIICTPRALIATHNSLFDLLVTDLVLRCIPSSSSSSSSVSTVNRL